MKGHRLVLFLLFLLWGCSVSDEEQIRNTLNQRGDAFRKKDLSFYLACFSDRYQDAEGDLLYLKKRVEGYFQTFEQIEYESWDRSIQIEQESATAVQQYRIEVHAGGSKKQFAGKEAFLLKKEGGRWRIVKGL